MQPALSAYARALTGKADVQVVVSQNSNGHTDGKKIFFRPPLALGDNTPHQRKLCDRRDPETMIQLCPACDVREQVLIVIYHEIGHIAFGSFEVMSEEERAEALKYGLSLVDKKYAAAVMAKVRMTPDPRKSTYIGMASLISPFLPGIVNALEDARVNREAADARKGTRIMFQVDTMRVLSEGFEQRMPDGTFKQIYWNERPLNAQMICAVYARFAGYKMEDFFVPEVIAALDDPKCKEILRDFHTVRNAKGVYALSIALLMRLRELGFYQHETDPEVEDEPQEEQEEDQQPEQPEDDQQQEEGEDDGADDPGDEGSSSEGADGDDQPDNEDAPDQESDDSGEAQGNGEPSEEQEDGDGAGGEDEGDQSGSESEGDEPGEDAGSGEGQSSDGSDDSSDAEPADSDVTEPDGSGDGTGGEAEGNGTADDAGEADNSDAQGGEVDEPDDQAGDSSAGSGEAMEDATPGSEGSTGGDDGETSDGGSGDGTPTDARTGDVEDDASGEGSDVRDGSLGEPSRDDDETPGEDSGSGDVDESAPESGDRTGTDVGGVSNPVADGDVPERTEATPEHGDRVPPKPEGREVGKDEAIDSGADEGLGGVEVIEDSAFDRLPMGTPEEVNGTIHEIAHPEERPDHIKEEAAAGKEMDRAIVQGLYFETPSRKVFGVREHYYDQPVMVGDINMSQGWDTSGYSHWGYSKKQLGIEGDFTCEEAILGPALLKMRVAFADNKRGHDMRNRKSGKVDARVLGKRVHFNDARLFKKRSIPGKKDYFVLIGIDISGSTIGENIMLAKRAAMAQAELCFRSGITFAVYAHSGNYHEPEEGRIGGLDMDIYHIKDPDEPWTDATRERLSKLAPDSVNLDGHTFEYYRKILDKRPETDKVMLYYTDGKMPAENHDEELIILKREIKICRQKKYVLMGVGIRTDSPVQHGLDTVEVNTDADLVKVVQHLEKRLLEIK
jgi:hypothetical protein